LLNRHSKGFFRSCLFGIACSIFSHVSLFANPPKPLPITIALPA
jgi:hypothetical protein